MSDAAETLLNGALEALQRGDAATCEASSSNALKLLEDGDPRIPEALSLRGTARLNSAPESGLSDLQEAVRLDPNEPQFLLGLGRGLMSLGRYSEAEPLLSRAFQLSRGHPGAAQAYGRCLIALNKAFQAMQVLGPLLETGRATSSIVRLFAEAQFKSDDVFGARDTLTQLHGAEGPLTTADRLQIARLDLQLRDFDVARKNIETIIANDPRSIDARLSAIRLMDWTNDTAELHAQLDTLKSMKPTRPEAMALIVDHSEDLDDATLGNVEKALSGPVMSEELAALGFSLALYFDRKEDYERAWHTADRTNKRLAEARGAVQTPAHRDAAIKMMDAQLSQALRYYEGSSEAMLAEEDERFIYLIGAPRTGSSLIQSLLSAPDGVVSHGERAPLYAYLLSVLQTPISDAGFHRLIGQLNTAERAGLVRQSKLAPVMVDKTPHHVFVAGLLERVHPGARFVQVFRDACDVALSMFLRPFATYFPEATDLSAIGDVLEFRLKAFEKWSSAGVAISPFSYEAFTRTPEKEGERLFQMAGLDWNPDYLDPARRPDAVPTFSSRQVRKPISAPKIPHWSHYRSFAPEAFDRLAEIMSAQNQITGQNTLS